MKLQSTLPSSPTVTSIEGDTVLATGEWNMIYASFIWNDEFLLGATVSVNGAEPDSDLNYFGWPSGVFSTDDPIFIGMGFIGQLKRIQIYSPAAYELNTKACDSTTCAFDIGFSQPPTCLKPICATPATYASFSSCEG